MSHSLPPLPYDYNALEPHMDEATVKLHHDLHHKGYVDGLNGAEARVKSARESGDFSALKSALKDVAFHGSGHFFHTMFWENMAPTGTGGAPEGDFLAQIEKDFGSLEGLKKVFSAAAVQVEGSGWAVLGAQKDGSLVVHQIEKHQDLAVFGVTPILVCDVWEHAYYLKYQNRRPEWVENFWSLVNWEDVESRWQALKNN